MVLIERSTPYEPNFVRRTVICTMKHAYLEVEDLRIFFAPSEAAKVMSAAALARDRGTWLEVRDLGGKLRRLLLPSQALIEWHEYDHDEVPAADETETDRSFDWAAFDFDMLE